MKVLERQQEGQDVMAEGRKRGTTLPHLRAWREYMVLSQVELADKAGLSRPTIARAETGQQIVEWPNIRKLAEALGISARQLLDQEPPQ